MTVHLLGLPHTQTTKAWATCAFTMKIQGLAAMLTGQGHDVTVYSGEDNDAAGQHVTVATRDDQARWFGEETWENRVFDRWDVDNDPCWVELTANMATAIRERAQPGDLISLTMGRAHHAVADALPWIRSAELGIGYEGIIPDGLHVFESSAWMHHSYGRFGIHDGRYFDAVIPNSFDPADLMFNDTPGDYVLFLGRHTPRKGLAVVQELHDRGVKVITAGQQGPLGSVPHMGVVSGQVKAELIAGARAVLVPTGYIEPFGGVAVEAQMCGTPVIATPWGAFPETVVHGETGFLCHTLGDYLDAVKLCGDLDRRAIRDRAVGKYSLDAVAPLYTAYLERVATLDRDGWYTT